LDLLEEQSERVREAEAKRARAENEYLAALQQLTELKAAGGIVAPEEKGALERLAEAFMQGAGFAGPTAPSEGEEPEKEETRDDE
jgi:hypothetical protein